MLHSLRMRILIATPLFPPDIAEPAPYVKELATRLSASDQVTVLMYGHLPEKVSGVPYVCIDKRAHLLTRLYQYSRALLRASRDADVVHVLNGPSTELPALILTLFSRTPVVFQIGDPRAHAQASIHWYFNILERLVRMRAHVVLTSVPLPKPEVLPFAPRPTEALLAYEHSWELHLDMLRTHFDYA